MPDEIILDAFVDALRERRDAQAFERLMVGGDESRSRAELMQSIDDNNDIGWLTIFLMGEPTALNELRAVRALERLQGRYPELWEQAVMSAEAVDA